MDNPGPKLIDVLRRAWDGGFKTKSNFAREYADELSRAVQLGLVTSRYRGEWGRIWRVTPSGCALLFSKEPS